MLEHELLTADEAAAYLRISRKTLYDQLVAGVIPAIKVGRSWRIHRSTLTTLHTPTITTSNGSNGSAS